MTNKCQYLLQKDQKHEIAQNLIDMLQKDATMTKQANIFIWNWILTGPN